MFEINSPFLQNFWRNFMQKVIEHNICLFIIDKINWKWFKEKIRLEFVHMSYFFLSKHRAKLAKGLEWNVEFENKVKCISNAFHFPYLPFIYIFSLVACLKHSWKDCAMFKSIWSMTCSECDSTNLGRTNAQIPMRLIFVFVKNAYSL